MKVKINCKKSETQKYKQEQRMEEASKKVSFIEEKILESRKVKIKK